MKLRLIMPHLTRLTISAYVLLIAVIIADCYFAEKHFWAALLLQLTPLILLLPGILHKYYRSYSWLCFLMLLYFASYVVQTYAPSRSFIDIIGLILSVGIFICAMFSSRYLQRLQRSIQAP